MTNCKRCKGKGEIEVFSDYGVHHLIQCPKCVKPNNKAGVVGKHK